MYGRRLSVHATHSRKGSTASLHGRKSSSGGISRRGSVASRRGSVSSRKGDSPNKGQNVKKRGGRLEQRIEHDQAEMTANQDIYLDGNDFVGLSDKQLKSLSSKQVDALYLKRIRVMEDRFQKLSERFTRTQTRLKIMVQWKQKAMESADHQLVSGHSDLEQSIFYYKKMLCYNISRMFVRAYKFKKRLLEIHAGLKEVAEFLIQNPHILGSTRVELQSELDCWVETQSKLKRKPWRHIDFLLQSCNDVCNTLKLAVEQSFHDRIRLQRAADSFFERNSDLLAQVNQAKEAAQQANRKVQHWNLTHDSIRDDYERLKAQHETSEIDLQETLKRETKLKELLRHQAAQLAELNPEGDHIHQAESWIRTLHQYHPGKTTESVNAIVLADEESKEILAREEGNKLSKSNNMQGTDNNDNNEDDIHDSASFAPASSSFPNALDDWDIPVANSKKGKKKTGTTPSSINRRLPDYPVIPGMEVTGSSSSKAPRTSQRRPKSSISSPSSSSSSSSSSWSSSSSHYHQNRPGTAANPSSSSSSSSSPFEQFVGTNIQRPRTGNFRRRLEHNDAKDQPPPGYLPHRPSTSSGVMRNNKNRPSSLTHTRIPVSARARQSRESREQEEEDRRRQGGKTERARRRFSRRRFSVEDNPYVRSAQQFRKKHAAPPQEEKEEDTQDVTNNNNKRSVFRSRGYPRPSATETSSYADSSDPNAYLRQPYIPRLHKLRRKGRKPMRTSKNNVKDPDNEDYFSDYDDDGRDDEYLETEHDHTTLFGNISRKSHNKKISALKESPYMQDPQTYISADNSYNYRPDDLDLKKQQADPPSASGLPSSSFSSSGLAVSDQFMEQLAKPVVLKNKVHGYQYSVEAHDHTDVIERLKKRREEEREFERANFTFAKKVRHQKARVRGFLDRDYLDPNRQYRSKFATGNE